MGYRGKGIGDEHKFSIDDLADGDDREFWRGYHREEINLAAILLLSSLPQLLIDSFKIPPRHKNAMHRAIAAALLKMAHGQQMDISFSKSQHVTTLEVEESVIKKSGEEMALFAFLAAHYVGAAKKTVDAYKEFGCHLGTAIQFVSDCYDIFRT